MLLVLGPIPLGLSSSVSNVVLTVVIVVPDAWMYSINCIIISAWRTPISRHEDDDGNGDDVRNDDDL